VIPDFKREFEWKGKTTNRDRRHRRFPIGETIPPHRALPASIFLHQVEPRSASTRNIVYTERLTNTLTLAHLLSRPFFIGKNATGALSQVFSNMLKKYRRCTKKWTKGDRINRAFKRALFSNTTGILNTASGAFALLNT
jgi:hypothetical protein